VPPGELPCLTSDFYSKYMLPAKPAGRARAGCRLSTDHGVATRRVYAGRLVLVKMHNCSYAEGGHRAQIVRGRAGRDALTADASHPYESCGAAAAGANVDVKKSSYKKLSKLLSTFEKKVRRALASLWLASLPAAPVREAFWHCAPHCRRCIVVHRLHFCFTEDGVGMSRGVRTAPRAS